MGNLFRNITACIGLVVFPLTASATLDSRAATVAGDSAYRHANGEDTRLDPDQVGAGRLAQTSEPAASPAAAPPDSKASQEPSPPPASAAPANSTVTTEITKPAKAVPTCALKFMGAEVAGKLKGRKWKEFRQEECGPTETQAVFPSAVAAKYSGVKPDKARTLTCADQFAANKATNANGGLKWIELGGGYYSECVSRLKG
jgi:hypothetical protein